MSTKNAYVEKMEAQLKQFGARFDNLKAKAQEQVADGKIKLERGKEASKAEYEAAVAKFTELKSAGDDKWESMKEHVEKAWAELTKHDGPKPPAEHRV
jgi:hypothetical protein